MSTEIKHSYKFSNRDDWVHYAMTNMRKIEAQQHNEVGTEVWLVRKNQVIGKWCEELNFGYIEEYRDEARLEADRLQKQEVSQ